MIQSESRLLDDLVRLGVRSQWHVPLLSLSVGGEESKNVVLDVRSEHVVVSPCCHGESPSKKLVVIVT